MTLRAILQRKGTIVHKIGPEASMADVVQTLVKHNCGSLVVCRGDEMVGIITERDVLRTCAECSEPLASISVASRMTAEMVTVRPDAPISEVMGLLTRRRIRHLPVVDGRTLIGLVSIGDIVKCQHDALTMENHFLKEYLMG